MARERVTKEEVYELTGEEESSFEPIRTDEALLFSITGAEVRTSKAGHPYVNYEATVTDGEYKGRKVFDVMGVHGSDADKTKKVFASLQDKMRALTGKPLVVSGTAQALAETVVRAIKGAKFTAKLSVDEPADTEAQEEWDEKGWTPKNRIKRMLPAESYKQSKERRW